MRSFQFIETDAMRILLFLLLGGLSASVFAAQPAPAELEPLPPPPVFDAGPDTGNPDEESSVTITKEAGQTVEEYRANGKVYMIKITPKHGAPYYLVDDQGDGKFVRQESLDSGFRPPRWVIRRF
ncbi:MAG: DUF2782 domain-containing protein [Gallionella sp.]|nr:DUF2782 domain-containing protein [Gallionella sp.]